MKKTDSFPAALERVNWAQVFKLVAAHPFPVRVPKATKK